ncbi:MAG: type II secretion system protein GspK [Deltaproteobacteria bacterium]
MINRKSEKGFALIVVILILLLVSVLVANLTMQVRSALLIATNNKERAASRFLAEGGVQLAIFRKNDRIENSEGTEYERFLEGYPYETTISEKGRIRYFLVSESGKIDLNTYPPELMQLFLSYQGLTQEQIDTVLDSLLDWRDPDDLHRVNGAEQDYYQSLADPYIPRNGRILEPSEFFLVKGTEPLVGKFDPEAVFTVYNSRSRINFNSLTPEMLAFLTGGDKDAIKAYYETLKEMQDDPTLGVRHFSAVDAENILGSERYAILRPYLVYSSNNRVYYVRSIGEAGYLPAAEPAAVDGEGKEVPKHLPGIKIEALYQWQNTGPKFLVWKERYS